MLTISIENCAGCQASGSLTSNQGIQPGYAPGESRIPDPTSKVKGFTYDTGKGTKTAVNMSGPMASIFRAALGQIFEKKPLLPDQVPSADGTMPEISQDPQNSTNVISNPQDTMAAQEAMAQNHHMALLASQMESEPEFEVVLKDFNKEAVEEQTQKVAGSGIYQSDQDPTQADSLEPSTKINMYATNVEDIIQPRAQEIITDLSEDAETVAFVQLDGLAVNSDEESFTHQVAASQEAMDLGYRAALKLTLERMINNPRVTVVLGVKEFKDYLVSR